jgi:hypothetical protein
VCPALSQRRATLGGTEPEEDAMAARREPKPRPSARPTVRRRAAGPFLRGAAQTAAIVCGFLGLGLLGGALAGAGARGAEPRGVERPRSDYTLDVAPATAEPSVWLVDGYNALHVGLLRGGARGGEWWTGASREALLERVRRFDAGGADVWVVFDGPDARELVDPGAPEDAAVRPRLVFAPSADEWLLRRAGEAGPGVAVVTADRRLADRARARGATIVSPRDFLARCEAGEETASI